MANKDTIKAKEDIRVAAENALKLVNKSAEENAKLLASAILDASKLLASQAESARQVVATQASEALKVSNSGKDSDHDLLLTFSAEVKAELKFIRDDIKEIKDGTARQLAEHETKINDIEVDYITKKEHKDVIDDIVMLKNWKNLLVGAGSVLTIIIALVVYIWTTQIGNINTNVKDVETKLDNHISQK